MGSYISKVRSTIILVCIGISLVACNKQPDSAEKMGENISNYTNQKIGYSFAVPRGFAHETDDDEGMYFGYSETSVYGNVSVQSYDALVSTSCSVSVTGISSAMGNALKADNKTQWGKVKPANPFNRNPPICQPFVLNADEDPDPLVTGATKYGSAYAFCSQKEDKIVVICVSQVKDNPELAKQIFETFRWTE